MICPMCNQNQTYRKERTVKDGYTKDNGNGGFYFIQTGIKNVIDEWWTCKKCTKRGTINDYTNFMIKYFNEMETLKLLKLID